MLTSQPPALPGFRMLPARLAADVQARLVAVVLERVEAAGWLTPVMPRTGRPYSIRMCSMGPLGWVSDLAGYRYVSTHPLTDAAWPPIPEALLRLWDEITGWTAPPECCLVNLYRGSARLGLHRDADEAELRAPVLSISLGDTAVFRLGGLTRNDPTRSIRLHSGDVVVLGGDARLAYHGIDRVLPGTSALVPGRGRINLTLRRVTCLAS